MKIAIVGAGLIGRERIEAVQHISKLTNGEVSISAVYDIDTNALISVAHKYQVPIVHNIVEVMDTNPDWVFIATTNDAAATTAKIAFHFGANVLVEKPLGRTLEECEEIIAAKPEHLQLYVGFNYRFFAGIEAALHDARSGKFGKLISVNLILGHGHAPGMEKSWRLDPANCSGAITDLGVHAFDLILQLASGNVSVKHAQSWSGYWNTGIEEESHILLTDEAGTIFNAQVSFNRWKSTFKFEINGTEGYGVVDNRGRSYGPQSYRTGVRWGWSSGKTQAESEILVVDKDNCSDSFIKETISVLGFSDYIKDYNLLSSACTWQESKNTMGLLEQYKSKINNS